MEINASLVKELREKTGAGMMDCKKALTESEGDFEKAIEILRKKGAAVASKRAERSANEGIILTKIYNDGKSSAIVELNCETDFVARSQDFIDLANLMLENIVANNPQTLEQLLSLPNEGKTLNDTLLNVLGKIGEKIEVSRFKIVNAEDGLVVDYVHHGSKLGVLVRMDNISAEAKDEFAGLLKDVAMQAAAMKPLFLNRDEVPHTVIEKEIEIYKELALKEGKPAQVVEKIAIGKLEKYYQENCLLEQQFIKDNSKSVNDLVKEINTKYNAKSEIKQFFRFHVSDENK